MTTSNPGEPPLAVPPANIRRVVFLGTPQASVPSLRALVAAGYEVEAVITQPDRRRGRGSKTIPAPVKAAATELGLTVEHDLAVLDTILVDLAVVVAYGRMIPRRVLERIPMINVHFSLLPRWRGAAPVERAILAGDTQTGVGIMAVAEGLDTGDVYSSSRLAIGSDTTAETLTSDLADLGAELLVTTLAHGLIDADGIPAARPQQGEPTYAAKLTSEERELDFGQSAVDLDRRIRIGRAWTSFRGERLGVERAVPHGDVLVDDQRGTITTVGIDGIMVATPQGSLELVVVKPEGRRSQPVGAWINGSQPRVGERLGAGNPAGDNPAGDDEVQK